MTKRIWSTVFSLVLMFTAFFSPLATTKSYGADHGQIKVEQIENTKNKVVYQFTHENGEIEYLTQYVDEYGNYSFEAKYNNKVDIIKRVNGNVYVNGKLELELNQTSNHYLNGDNFQIFAWTSPITWRESSNIRDATIAYIAGILASAYGGPATGMITTMATTLYSLSVTTVYYEITQWVDYGTKQAKNVMKVYSDSKYQDYIGQETHIFYFQRP